MLNNPVRRGLLACAWQSAGRAGRLTRRATEKLVHALARSGRSRFPCPDDGGQEQAGDKEWKKSSHQSFFNRTGPCLSNQLIQGHLRWTNGPAQWTNAVNREDQRQAKPQRACPAVSKRESSHGPADPAPGSPQRVGSRDHFGSVCRAAATGEAERWSRKR
jgi:hypothetical protein